MDQFMSHNGRRGKHLPAVWTWMTEQFLIVFAPLVLFQGSFLFKGFLALRAGMLFLVSGAAVDEMQVAYQVGPLGERFSAFRAKVRSFSCMDPAVGKEICVGPESQTALSALER